MHRYGWKRDVADERDFSYALVHPRESVPVLPARADNSRDARLIAPYDQGQLGSCTANAWSTMMAYLHPGFLPSRLALYYEERLYEGTVDQDDGAQIRTGPKVLAATGVGTEVEWPYLEAKFRDDPSLVEREDAPHHRALVYSRLAGAHDYMTCLAAGFPFVIGITLYESFESEDVAQYGIVPMPGPDEQVIGGHAITPIGYDDNFEGKGHRYYEVRNSWGIGWGQHGNFWIPARYLENLELANDAWTLRKTT